MDSPTTTNKTATVVDTIIAQAMQLAEKTAETGLDTSLEASVPFFALPVIKQVTEEVIKLVVEKVGDRISVNLQTAGTFIVIDTQVSNEKSGISQALQNLMIAEKSGNADAIRQAIQAYADAQSRLIHDDGSAPPQ